MNLSNYIHEGFFFQTGWIFGFFFDIVNESQIVDWYIAWRFFLWKVQVFSEQFLFLTFGTKGVKMCFVSKHFPKWLLCFLVCFAIVENQLLNGTCSLCHAWLISFRHFFYLDHWSCLKHPIWPLYRVVLCLLISWCSELVFLWQDSEFKSSFSSFHSIWSSFCVNHPGFDDRTVYNIWEKPGKFSFLEFITHFGERIVDLLELRTQPVTRFSCDRIIALSMSSPVSLG